MFIFGKVDGNDHHIDQFEITGSTYEPKGDILFNGSKFNCADRSGLVELAECAALCNDSALDYNEVSFPHRSSQLEWEKLPLHIAF